MHFNLRSCLATLAIVISCCVTLLSAAGCYFLSSYAIPITIVEAKSDSRAASELSFYIGVLVSTPIWLASIWVTTIAFAVHSRPIFKLIGFLLFVSAAIVLILLANERPDFKTG
jgi:hypothetical protein